MPDLTKTHFTYLQNACKKLLGRAIEGSMSYIRCLPAEVLQELSVSTEFSLEGWEIYLVSEGSVKGSRVITADRAVDLREEKQGCVLLLIDSRTAGTGMDGIYSAVREIREDELLDEAKKQVSKSLNKPLRDFLNDAIHIAARLGRSNQISPWQQFDLYASSLDAAECVGSYLTRIGLWPIWLNGEFRQADLNTSFGIVERLFLSHSPGATVPARVGSLLLPEEATAQVAELERFLRSTNMLHWKEAVSALSEHPTLWVNRLVPGFQNQTLKRLDLVPWRGSRSDAAPLGWSGLKRGEEDTPILLLERENPTTTKLEVRWKVLPTGIRAGAVDYKVAIITGSGVELAARQVTHVDKDPQRCVFTSGDFEELFESAEDGKWEVRVLLHPVGQETPGEEDDSPIWRKSEEFILTFGTKDADVKSSVGKRGRSLVEEAIKLTEEDFTQAATVPLVADSKGNLTFRVNSKSGRVYRPPLIHAVEENWQQNNFQPGRWVVQIRTESAYVGPPEFLPLRGTQCEPVVWRRLEDTTRQLAQKALLRGGFVGLIYRDLEGGANYVNAWAAALESGGAALALAHTVEVQSFGGRTIGLIVLPSHPLRVAWHQAYDELAHHIRFVERLKAAEVIHLLKSLDGSYFPAFLPSAVGGASFVFGDMLGFHAVAMIPEGDPEPQATIAILARCLAPAQEHTAPSIGLTAATAIAREIGKYQELHEQYRNLRIHALRPGDGLTITQALGLALHPAERKKDEAEADLAHLGVGFTLELFPSPSQTSARVLGRFLAEMTERRRAGIGSLSAEDAWLTENVNLAGNVMPRLRWAKRNTPEPEEPAHLSIAFDTFGSEIEALNADELPSPIRDPRPLEAFGLGASIVRHFAFTPVPTWTSTQALNVDGEKHPAGRGYSERLIKINQALLQVVAASRGIKDASRPHWPVLKTYLKANETDLVKRLHDLSDWVVTIDRNVGVEYFDTPRQEPEVYNTYVIDCVPERQDQSSIQLVTSTSHLDEVRRLLTRSLLEMGLSQSRRNCDFLIQNLKAISGRLAMRLASKGSQTSELIALALFHAQCLKPDGWLSLAETFLVPVDDIRELVTDFELKKLARKTDGTEEEQNQRRADLIGVSLSKRGLLQFKFIEIKNRRTLRSACDSSLYQAICEQTEQTRERWLRNFFSEGLSLSERVIRRRRLARALSFYLEKARRHYLAAESYPKLAAALDKLFRSDAGLAGETEDLGIIFCPEHHDRIKEVHFDRETRISLFGPLQMPDTTTRLMAVRSAMLAATEIEAYLPSTSNHEKDQPIEVVQVSPVTELDMISDLVREEVSVPITEAPQLSPEREACILLGHTLSTSSPVNWKMTIRGNPHLMIVGLPGMGKTTTIINLCDQLYRSGVVPIIFAFHDDIEEKLRARFGELHYSDIENGLGFNPMRIVGQSAHAWLDNVGMLRDIFAAINPDFGDLQNNEIREAVKQCYIELGYQRSQAELPLPEFQRFVDILKARPKPHPGVLARLQELDDYGFFRSTGMPVSLLDNERPTIIRLYATQNEALQRAMASFILLNIYQNMFLRGLQPTLTHAVIFDEAHRASRLKLIPTMAKECRKYGLSLVLASQEARDFDQSLYSAIANYLVLRVTETDAKVLANNVASFSDAKNIAARLKQLAKFSGMFCTEGKSPTFLQLLSEIPLSQVKPT